MHISNKIKCHISKELKDIDSYKLLQSIVFFASDVLEPYEDLYKKAMFVVSNDKDMKCQGKFFIIREELYFHINFEQIQAVNIVELGFKSFKKSLFFTIIHELGHGVYTLSTYDKTKTLEQYCDDTDKQIGELQIEIKKKNPEYGPIETSRLIPEEIYADRFAYKNLSYFENLYDFEGILI